MFTKRVYSIRMMLRWTRHDIILFTVMAAIPVVLYEILDQRWLRVPWLPIALIGTAVAFILGFQNNATYDRIWEARKIWGGITNASRAWALMVKDYITNEFADDHASPEALQAIKQRLILRHVAWLTALRHVLRSPRPWENFQGHKTNREWSEVIQVREHHHTLEEEMEGYLTDEERARVCPLANVPTQVMALQSGHLRELHAKGLLDDFRHMEMQNTLGRLLDGQGKTERIKGFPYPRQYATLNAFFVWIFLVLLPVGLVPEFHRIASDLHDEFPGVSEWFIWLSVPFSVIVMWVFHTMERIGRTGENPFEGSANDVPITTIARSIEIDIRQIIGDDPASIPAPIEAKYHTQM